ncbi:uncharacterized protein LTHEOB_626 [Lasiodiplodia theobromae]|uniref:uncharacterized protein n=1 Tax=Lasiodiplodia theobromae TaxID=45133 RepID=UPI0015C32352|nr:uncharacterized protein LTHEOB_626 [Lasiodiplodia theobromae]KAF4540684.1 hypothetical protein LTHEOB_626 [Lasiodiplodia theobromae]
MLLHGFPGVGKTSTAECIAAKIQRPLYPITCGDLGTDVETVDRRLGQIFSKAQKWDSVLLLDEADVFLGERTKDDIARNALVSVFLRTLEYYDGLLFLTTNRVGTLDEAFRSRIHATLYYPPLNIEQTLAIWDVNMRRIKEFKQDGIDLDPQEIKSFAWDLWQWIEENNRTQWNGRQIRNAFQTALALAEHERSVETGVAEQPGPQSRIFLSSTHFKKVARTIVYFDEYLGTAHHGLSQSERAYAKGQRADQYGRPQPQPTSQPFMDDRKLWASSGPGSNRLFDSEYPSNTSTPQKPRAGNFSRNARDYRVGGAQEGYGGQDRTTSFQREAAPFGFSGTSQDGYNDMGSRMTFGSDASQIPKKPGPPPF